MKIGPTLTVDEVLKLFKHYLGVDIQRAALYDYITKKGFPLATGWGRPRKWLRAPVLTWFKKQSKSLNKN